MPTKQRERARSPGKSPRMPVGQSIEPPKDLWELRRICPGMKWGSNVPPPVRAAEAGDAVSPRRFESGLPTAYLMATRGDIRESHHPAPVPTLAPRARKASPIKSRRRKTLVRCSCSALGSHGMQGRPDGTTVQLIRLLYSLSTST
ncbi:hypothetical protein DIPPA_30218 [Diplonema papillatum]|nr:hypothetical protein DIPPA_30218 [Diplonema papillatum]